jgi:hypothetical protein
MSDDASELVQAAALEVIKAMKAFLDVAEAVVREPAVAASVGKAFADAATSAFRSSTSKDEAPDDDPGEDADEPPAGRVRRIDVSD